MLGESAKEKLNSEKDAKLSVEIVKNWRTEANKIQQLFIMHF